MCSKHVEQIKMFCDKSSPDRIAGYKTTAEFRPADVRGAAVNRRTADLMTYAHSHNDTIMRYTSRAKTLSYGN